ncbi:MAG: energy transducer TonB [Gammaproteobacteria bacterium]
MTTPPDEPSIPPRLQRPLAALWISLGLHAALIALIQVVPPTAGGTASLIEARLVLPHTPLSAATVPPDSEAATPGTNPLVADDAADTVPAVTKPAPAQPVPPAAVPAPPASPAGPAIAIPVDLTFYTARQLDVQPRALGSIEPDYPPDADREQRSGKVRLQLKLEADGRVSDVEVVQADPPGVFDDSAVRAFRDARFSPAQKDGRAVRALLLIEVEYNWAGER